jgi:DNA-binding NarL/FixJ family response regulator
VSMVRQEEIEAVVERDTSRIPVWLVDDNKHYSETVSSILNESSEVECTRTFSRCEAAIEALQHGDPPPSVILLDIQMPGIGGLDAIEPLKEISPLTSILMITVYNDEDYIRIAMKQGASGYLLKQSSAMEFIRAIQNVVNGGMPVDPFVVPKMMKIMKMAALERTPASVYGLTDREKKFLRHIANGLNDQQIATRMGVSYNTVLYHTKNIHEKLNVHSRRELIAKAHKERLI